MKTPLAAAGKALPLASLMVLMHAGTALAQQYPVKPVTVIIPYTAGGSTEADTRPYTQRLGDALGKTFIMDYKPGAGTTVGTAFVAKAAPDGYTLLSTTSTIAVAQVLYKNLTYDAVTSFAPISTIYARTLLLVANANLPASNWQEYVAYVRANPGKLNVGTVGAGGSYHIGSAWLHGEFKGNVTHVHYKGSNPLLIDMLAGRTDAMISSVFQSMPHMKSGKLRAIAALGRTRSPLLPDLRTADEQGLKGFDFTSWGALFAPAKTPDAIINRLNAEIVKISKLPESVKRVELDGTSMISSSPQELRDMLAKEIGIWRKVVAENNITSEE
jgi:tripartite-type tricarboxylate transporter receptor subunit TctC